MSLSIDSYTLTVKHFSGVFVGVVVGFAVVGAGVGFCVGEIMFTSDDISSPTLGTFDDVVELVVVVVVVVVEAGSSHQTTKYNK